MSRETKDRSVQKRQIVRACHVNSHTMRACRVEYCVVTQRASDWNRSLPEEWLLDYGVLRLTSVRHLVGVDTLLLLHMPDLVFARRLLDDARLLPQNTHLDIPRD